MNAEGEMKLEIGNWKFGVAVVVTTNNKQLTTNPYFGSLFINQTLTPCSSTFHVL